MIAAVNRRRPNVLLRIPTHLRTKHGFLYMDVGVGVDVGVFRVSIDVCNKD
jgi:hypothetical protein